MKSAFFLILCLPSLSPASPWAKQPCEAYLTPALLARAQSTVRSETQELLRLHPGLSAVVAWFENEAVSADAKSQQPVVGALNLPTVPVERDRSAQFSVTLFDNTSARPNWIFSRFSIVPQRVSGGGQICVLETRVDLRPAPPDDELKLLSILLGVATVPQCRFLRLVSAVSNRGPDGSLFARIHSAKRAGLADHDLIAKLKPHWLLMIGEHAPRLGFLSGAVHDDPAIHRGFEGVSTSYGDTYFMELDFLVPAGDTDNRRGRRRH